MIAWAPKIMTSSFAPPFHRRPKRPRGHPCQKGFLYPSEDAGVAQLAEQLFCKQQVTGSIPVAGSTCRIFRTFGSTRADPTRKFRVFGVSGQERIERPAIFMAGFLAKAFVAWNEHQPRI